MPGLGAYGAKAFEDMWRATRSYYEEKLIDNLQRSHPLLDKVARKGNFEAKEGEVGKRVVHTILAHPNEGVKAMALDGEIGDNPTQLLEQIEYEWKLMMCNFTLNDKVLKINRSSELKDLLEINQKAQRLAFADYLSKQLYSYGKDKYAMGGLKYLLSDNPYQDGLVVLNLPRGGEPGDKYEFWRNRVGQWTPATDPLKIAETDPKAGAEALVEAMRHMVQILENGGDRVDGIYTSYGYYNLYANYLQDKLRFVGVKEKEDGVFPSVEFMGVPLYLDKYCPQRRIYFINSNYFHFVYLKGENFVQEIKENPTRFSKNYITTFMGNFLIEKPRAHGVLYVDPGVTTPGLPTDCNVADWANFKDYDYFGTEPTSTDAETQEREGFSGSGVYDGKTSV